jgi:hypothetical protein
MYFPDYKKRGNASDYLDAWPRAPKYGKVGYLYLLEDLAVEEFCKVGKARCLRSRLFDYNSVRPGATCRYIAVSECFVDFAQVESRVLKELKKQIPALSCRKEWFWRCDLKLIIDVLVEAEKYFEVVKQNTPLPKYPKIFGYV